jgi:O-antigen/teichoic acid export membrane protein
MRGDQPVLTPVQKADASYYERAGYAMTQPITIMGKLSDSVLFSGMSHLQEDEIRLRKMLLTGIHVISLVLVPVSVYMVFFSGYLIQLWLGAEFIYTAFILKILFWAVVFRSLSKLGDSLLRAKDAVFIGSGIKAVYVLLMATGIYLTAAHGMEWVAWAVVASTCIHFAMNMQLCTQLIHITWLQISGALLPSVLLGAILFPTCWLLHIALLFTGGNNIFVLMISIVIFMSMTSLLIFCFPSFLGKNENCILRYLPAVIQNRRLCQNLLRRCGGA